MSDWYLLLIKCSYLGGSICEPMMQTTMAGRVMLIHQLVMKGDLKELKKEIAKDIGLLWGLLLVNSSLSS